MSNEDQVYPIYDITSEQRVGLLPIRGEKRLVTVTPTPNNLPPTASPQNTPSSQYEYEALSFVKKTLTDYVTIRLPGRLHSNPATPSAISNRTESSVWSSELTSDQTASGSLRIEGTSPTAVPPLPNGSNLTGPGPFDQTTLTSVNSIPSPRSSPAPPPDIIVEGSLDSTNFIYRFLANPKSISIAHQTADTHSMTRAGWQFGVWGEDTIDLSITGVTAGQYFNTGLTDRWREYSVSYRNLLELVNIFENNGYYFEGEPLVPSVYDADFTRKRIKMHQDVELRVGNFIWKGMFTNMTIDESADTPFLIKFTLGFIAWKESYSSASPWISPKDSNKYRGHAQEINFV